MEPLPIGHHPLGSTRLVSQVQNDISQGRKKGDGAFHPQDMGNPDPFIHLETIKAISPAPQQHPQGQELSLALTFHGTF